MIDQEWKYLILIFLSGEIGATLIFYLISMLMHTENQNQISLRSVIKGIIERMFLVASFAVGFPQALTVFGALKIATRIKDKDDHVSNDYFLIGNIVSVMLAMVYFKVWENF